VNRNVADGAIFISVYWLSPDSINWRWCAPETDEVDVDLPIDARTVAARVD
jgi:hypothetical protein